MFSMMIRSPRFCWESRQITHSVTEATAELRMQTHEKLIRLPVFWCCHQSFDGDIDDANVVIRLVGLGVHLDVADVLRHLHALHHPAKHRVFVVQPWLKHIQQSCTTLMAVTPDQTQCACPATAETQQSCTTLMAVTPDQTQCACPAMAETYRIITTLMAVMGGGGGGEEEHKPCPTFRGENRQRGVALSQPPQASNKMNFINNETLPFWCSVIYTPIFHCLIQTLT